MVRLKTRYLLFEILYPEEKLLDVSDPIQAHVDLRQPSHKDVDSRKLNKLIRDTIQANFGEYGIGVVASTIAVRYFSPTTNTGILRVSRQHFRLAWAGLTYLSQINGRRCVITVVKVSGTIKKCEEAAIQRDRKNIHSALLRFADHDDRDDDGGEMELEGDEEEMVEA